MEYIIFSYPRCLVFRESMVKQDMDKKFNALKHGLLAKQAVINPQESRQFNKLSKRLMSELQPVSALQLILADQVVINYWRLMRYLKLENELFLFIGQSKFSFIEANFIDEFTTFIRKNPSFDVLNRYNVTIFKQFYRSLQEYQNLKLNNNTINKKGN